MSTGAQERKLGILLGKRMNGEYTLGRFVCLVKEVVASGCVLLVQTDLIASGFLFLPLRDGMWVGPQE